MVRAEMIWIFPLPDQMTWPTHKNDVVGIEKSELIRKMMCVHAGTTANPAFAAFSVVNQPADLLPTGRIHEFFVGHANMYPDPFDFCRISHEFLEVSCGIVRAGVSDKM